MSSMCMVDIYDYKEVIKMQCVFPKIYYQERGGGGVAESWQMRVGSEIYTLE